MLTDAISNGIRHGISSLYMPERKNEYELFSRESFAELTKAVVCAAGYTSAALSFPGVSMIIYSQITTEQKR